MSLTAKQLLGRVACELESAARMASALQDQLELGSIADLNVESMQALDALTQELSCMAKFLLSIGTAIRCDCRICPEPAISDCSLKALAGRLTGVPADLRVPAAGSYELFD